MLFFQCVSEFVCCFTNHDSLKGRMVEEVFPLRARRDSVDFLLNVKTFDTGHESIKLVLLIQNLSKLLSFELFRAVLT